MEQVRVSRRRESKRISRLNPTALSSRSALIFLLSEASGCRKDLKRCTLTIEGGKSGPERNLSVDSISHGPISSVFDQIL